MSFLWRLSELADNERLSDNAAIQRRTDVYFHAYEKNNDIKQTLKQGTWLAEKIARETSGFTAKYNFYCLNYTHVMIFNNVLKIHMSFLEIKVTLMRTLSIVIKSIN